MFEKVILRRSEQGPITLGEIAEAMLFYQNVHVIFDYSLFVQVVERLGMTGLIDLLNRYNVTATYCPQSLATLTQKIGAIEHHDFAAYTYAGDQEKSKIDNTRDALEYILTKRGYDKSNARKFVEAFLKKVPIKKITDESYVPGGITKVALQDVYDNDFLIAAVNEALSRTEGANRITNLNIEILKTHIGFHALSNIEFSKINGKRQQLTPPLEALTFAHLLTALIEARLDAGMAAYYGGDFKATNISSGIIGIRSQGLLRRAGLNHDQLSEFQMTVIAEGRKVSEVIDSGERSFDEFTKLLDRSKRFQQWLGKIHPDHKLIKAYLDEMGREDWIQSLPAKGIRYTMTTIADLASPALGKALSLADAFLLDKMLKGWRPNHFIKDRLIPFVMTDNIV